MNLSEQEKFQTFYDSLWKNGIEHLSQGRVQLDPYLTNLTEDKRRGISVIARIEPRVNKKIQDFINAIRHLEPDQYFYNPDQLHITILSLFTATEEYAPFLKHIPKYKDVLASVLSQVNCIDIVYKGITATSSAIMIQGFTEQPYLNQVRDWMRSGLIDAGLGEALDGRYKNDMAHSTAIRFKNPLRDPDVLIQKLEDFRYHEFGKSKFNSFQLVLNDWYMSIENLKILEEYDLKS